MKHDGWGASSGSTHCYRVPGTGTDGIGAVRYEHDRAAVIDPNPPVTATVYHLMDGVVDGVYEESQRAEGQFAVSEPCALTIDLGALLPPS